MKNFLSRPKLIIPLAAVIAVIIGCVWYHSFHRQPVYQYATVTTGSISAISGSQSPTQDLTLAFVNGGTIHNVSVKVGDRVTGGEVLATLDAENALGALNQAKGAYEAAQANYQKTIHGATPTTLAASQTTVQSAETNLAAVTLQQNQLVADAYGQLLSQDLQAIPDDVTSPVTPPVISGSYTGTQEGTINIEVYHTTNPQSGEQYFTAYGLVNATGIVSTTTPEPIGTSGLYITFSTTGIQPRWMIAIPNTNSTSYLANYNAYQTAQETKNQSVTSAQAVLDEANAELNSTTVAARPEDVAAAQAQVQSAYGALQIAQSAYNDMIISAPSDGTITMVAITPGQIASPNTPAIEMSTTTTARTNVLIIPKNAIITNNATSSVEVKSADGTIHQQSVVIGSTDTENAEVLSGLSLGDQVVLPND